MVAPAAGDEKGFKVYWQRWIMLMYMSVLNLLSDWTCYSVAPIALLTEEGRVVAVIQVFSQINLRILLNTAFFLFLPRYTSHVARADGDRSAGRGEAVIRVKALDPMMMTMTMMMMMMMMRCC